MTEKQRSELSRKAVMAIRSTASAFGALLLLAGVFAGETGLSPGEGIGHGQIILSLFGALLLCAGLMWNKFPAFYNVLGKILFSVFLAFAFLELTSAFLLRIGLGLRSSDEREGFVLKFDDKRESHYHPFVAWRGREPERFTGTGLILLGGSELALPPEENGRSLLVSALDSVLLSRGRTGVFDQSQPFYSTPQSLVALILELREGTRPSEVLLLSGPGDVLTGLTTGDPTIFLATDVFRTLTWNGTDWVLSLSELQGESAAREKSLPALAALLDDTGVERFPLYEPFRALPELSPGELDERAGMIAKRIGACCISMEALSQGFSFQGSIVWISLHPDTDRNSSVLFDLHMRTDSLIRSLTDSFPNLAVVEVLPSAPPGEVGSGYSGFDAAQSRRLAVSILETTL